MAYIVLGGALNPTNSTLLASRAEISEIPRSTVTNHYRMLLRGRTKLNAAK